MNNGVLSYHRMHIVESITTIEINRFIDSPLDFRANFAENLKFTGG